MDEDVGSTGGLAGEGGARTATAARGTVTMWTAPMGMVMAAIGIVTAATGIVVAAMRKAKTALEAFPIGIIATGIVAVLMSIKGSRYIFSNDIEQPPTCNGGLGCHTDSTIRRRGLELGYSDEVC